MILSQKCVRFRAGVARGVISLLLASMLWGCSAAPKLADYPVSEIDRPFTLPKGLATWTTYSFYAHTTEEFLGLSYVERVWVPAFPLVWSSALSDDWQLDWIPLPLMARHQLWYNKTGYLGLVLGMGGGYGEYSGVFLQPLLGVSYRHRLAPEWAMDLTASVSPTFRFRRSQYNDFSANLKAGALYQASTSVWIEPTVEIVGRTLNDYELITGSESSSSRYGKASSFTFRLPLTLASGWLFARQWEAGASYTYASIGYANDYRSHLATLRLTHYW